MDHKTFTLFWGSGDTRTRSSGCNVSQSIAESLLSDPDIAKLDELAVGAELIDGDGDTWERTA